MQNYLSKVTNIKQVERLEEFALSHSKGLATGRQKCPYVLQTEELRDGKQLLVKSESFCVLSVLCHTRVPLKNDNGEPVSF